MTFLARCKLIHEKITDEESKDIDSYVNSLNSAMKFEGKNVITPAELDPNPSLKEHVKGMMNQGDNSK